MNQKTQKIWKIDEKDFPVYGSKEEKIKFLLNYAILAPSSHNMQSWKFRISETELDLFLDPDRKLPFSDRTLRQGFISLGCALCNILLASERFGLGYSFEMFPEDSDDEVAVRILFQSMQKNRKLKGYSSLFSQITKRNTNRFPHIKKEIPKSVVEAVYNIVKKFGVNVEIFSKTRDLEKVAQIVSNASYEAFKNKIFKEELSKWVISVYSSRKDGIPLFDFGMPHPLTVFASQLIKIVPPMRQREIDYQSISNSASAIVLSSKNDFKEDWINIGIAFEIIWLYLTSQNLSIAPMAAAIEHPESRAKLQQLLISGSFPMVFARLGYSSNDSVHSPRKTAEDVLI